MRLAIVTDEPLVATALADEDGDGIDDETGEPVEEEVVDETDEEGEEEAPEDEASLIEYVLVVEGVETGDRRLIELNALEWVDPPAPFMATDETGFGHEGAKLVGQIVGFERRGEQIIGFVKLIDDAGDADVQRLQQRIESGELPGVSVDLDSVEATVTFEGELGEEVTENDDGTVTIDMSEPLTTVTSARIRAATAVPIQAFVEAEQLSMVASVDVDESTAQITTFAIVAAAVSAPVQPPREWLDDLALDRPTPLQITPEGRVFGHVALWDSCHRGFDQCVRPPQSKSNYAQFHTGTLVCDDGSYVSVGQITTGGGHADLSAAAKLARQHYDDAGWAAADVRCGEDDFGIWVAGAMRSDLTAEQQRAFMACDVSGDWRSIDGFLELIALASVPVPGFVKSHVASANVTALVASVPVCDEPVVLDRNESLADRIAQSIGRSRTQKLVERDRIAFGVDRHPSQRREELRRLVHGGR